MNIKPFPKAVFLQMAKYSFEHKMDQHSWQYLFIWAMYDHWVKQYWEEE